MFTWTRSNRTAFTLIELLVVVAIIGVLISMILPSLREAREQAKVVKCLANLSEIGKAMQMYFTDENNWFPFEKRNYTNGAPLHAFHYGGHPGRNVGGGEWWGYTTPAYRDTFKGRPFNRYIYQDLPAEDIPPADPRFNVLRNAMTTFQCPSDLGGFFNNEVGESSPLGAVPLHFQTGSSYDLNYHFVWRWAANEALFPDGRTNYLQRGNNFLSKQFQSHSARFVILFEDPVDSALWNRIQRRGWHRKWNRHSFLFLDGHAAYTLADTRQDYGANWKAASQRFWYDTTDPDYQYRNLGPR